MSETTERANVAGNTTTAPDTFIGGKRAALSQGATKLLGFMAFWTVPGMLVPIAALNKVLTSFGFAPIEGPTHWQAFLRSTKSLNHTGIVKPAWDSSAYVPINGDRLTYQFKTPPKSNLTVAASRIVAYPARHVDGGLARAHQVTKAGERLENMAVMEFKQPIFKQKDGTKFIAEAASFTVEDHHGALGEAGVAALRCELEARFEAYMANFTADDVRAWLKAQFSAVDSIGMKSAVEFIPIRHKVTFLQMEAALSELAPYCTNVGAVCGVHHLNVEDVDEQRAWIADEVQKEVASRFKTLLKQVDDALIEADKKEPDKRAKRVEAILANFGEQAEAIKATMTEYGTLLQRTIELSLEPEAGEEDSSAVIIGSAERFNQIDAALKAKGIADSLASIVGEENVPQVEAIVASTRAAIVLPSEEYEGSE